MFNFYLILNKSFAIFCFFFLCLIKKIKGERYRLNIIVKELDQATVVEYQTAVVAFINCLIISTRRLTDRTRLRNEFIGKKNTK